MPIRRIVLASRRSPLAVAQAEIVAAGIRQARPHVEVHIETISTRGDEMTAVRIPQIGSKGVFTAELEQALLAGRVDAAVHSAKDMPVQITAGLTILATPPRGDVRDALICREGHTLQTLPAGAVIGTSSPRRAAQLLLIRPDLRTTPLRGNVQTRIEHVMSRHVDATVLAMAGLARLGATDCVSEVLGLDQMLPAPGQGTLVAQGRSDRDDLRELLACVHDVPTARELECERRVLAALHAGCQAPIAVLAIVVGDMLRCRVLVALPDGSRIARADRAGTIDDADELIANVLADLHNQAADEIIRTARAAPGE
jgi:hydroxymethylbilane synthase